jgi:hypothetical protein
MTPSFRKKVPAAGIDGEAVQPYVKRTKNEIRRSTADKHPKKQRLKVSVPWRRLEVKLQKRDLQRGV